MIRCGHVQSSTDRLENGLFKPFSEARVLIRGNTHRQSVLSKTLIDKRCSCTFAMNGIWHSIQVNHHARTVNKDHKTPQGVCAYFGKPNRKSELLTRFARTQICAYAFVKFGFPIVLAHRALSLLTTEMNSHCSIMCLVEDTILLLNIIRDNDTRLSSTSVYDTTGLNH